MWASIPSPQRGSRPMSGSGHARMQKPRFALSEPCGVIHRSERSGSEIISGVQCRLAGHDRRRSLQPGLPAHERCGDGIEAWRSSPCWMTRPLAVAKPDLCHESSSSFGCHRAFPKTLLG